jgi:hypothetical protein
MMTARSQISTAAADVGITASAPRGDTNMKGGAEVAVPNASSSDMSMIQFSPTTMTMIAAEPLKYNHYEIRLRSESPEVSKTQGIGGAAWQGQFNSTHKSCTAVQICQKNYKLVRNAGSMPRVTIGR